MRRVRWVTEGDYWDVDMSTPVTLDGVARPVAGGMTWPTAGGSGSRGARLSRHKQVDFFQRFMAAPFVPSYSPGRGFSLHRLATIPFLSSDSWLTTLLGEFNLQKFVSSIKRTNGSTTHPFGSSWFKTIGKKLSEKSLYALNLCSELLLTPDDTLLFNVEHNGNKDTYRKKALLHHKFLNHNLTLEASSPELFVDHNGNYWDIPFSLAVDLASVASNVGSSYHFSINHDKGTPNWSGNQVTNGNSATICAGLSAKGAFAIKRRRDIWRSTAPKLKFVQPYDILLSTPHISASGVVGAILTAFRGENTATSQAEGNSELFRGFTLHAPKINSIISADTFGSLLFSAQHGNFQRLFLDLTRVHARLDFSSGSKFLSGAALVAQGLYKSNQPRVELLQNICPKATVSLQQQIVGPFSFRVDSEVSLDLKSISSNEGPKVRAINPVFAIEYALQVLGSARIHDRTSFFRDIAHALLKNRSPLLSNYPLFVFVLLMQSSTKYKLLVLAENDLKLVPNQLNLAVHTMLLSLM